MPEIKSVNNPLTVIAIFAGIAEAVGTGLFFNAVGKELQFIFVYFVTGFPALIATAFFLTLNFNSKVLYAPSDFKNEKNFIKTNTISKLSSTSINTKFYDQALIFIIWCKRL